MGAQLIESTDRHEWTFTGHRLTELRIDRESVRLVMLEGEAAFEVRLGAPFTLTGEDGRARTVDPADPTELVPLLTLLGRRVERLVISGEMELAVELADGVSIAAGPRPAYEAWEVRGDGTLGEVSYLCAPA